MKLINFLYCSLFININTINKFEMMKLYFIQSIYLELHSIDNDNTN